MKVKVDNFGRLLIPKEIREDMGLKPGTIVVLLQRNDDLIIKTPEDKLALEEENGLVIFTGEAVGDIESSIEKQRQKRDKKIGGF